MIKKIGGIILLFCLNLFAFLSIGHILGAILGKNPEFTILFLLASFIPLGFFLFIEIKKATEAFSYITGNDKKTVHGRKNID